MRKIKILFVISNINIGGPQKSLLALLDNMDYKFFDINICVLKPGGSLEVYYNENVKFLNTPEIITALTLPNDNIVKYLSLFLKNGELGMFFSSVTSLFKHVLLKKNMNQERQKLWKKYHDRLPKIEGEYDLAFGILGLSTYAIVDLANATNKYHWIRSDTRILNRNTGIDAEYYKRVDGSLSVSKETAKIFEDIYPFMKGRVQVFYNHIPVSFYEKMEFDKSLMQVEQGTWKIITITRLDPLKGIELAIDACKILVEKGCKIKWFILGDGKYKDDILRMIKEKGIDNSFILLGFQINTLSFIKEADIFVHPSRTEGKSNAVDEAKYVGKPIIVTNYDTVGEQIQHNVNGLICNMDGNDIARSIEKMMINESLRNKLISNCKDNLDALEETTEFFIDLLNDRRNL